MRVRLNRGFVTMALGLTLISCSSGSDSFGPNPGPWVGNWVQVNFLSIDDGGVWDEDDLTGIGFVADITETEWRETDEYGGGCSVLFSYSVGSGNKHRKRPQSVGAACPSGFSVDQFPDETGRLEFSADNRFMTEYYDLLPGDEITAFKWMRR